LLARAGCWDDNNADWMYYAMADCSGRPTNGLIGEWRFSSYKGGVRPASEVGPAVATSQINNAGLASTRNIVEGVGLQLTHSTYAYTSKFTTALGAARTISAYVTMNNDGGRGGAVIGLDQINGHQFDSLVWAERQTKKWMAGSNHFTRTKDIAGATEETAFAPQKVMVTLVYSASGEITMYRNGVQYGSPYTDTTSTYGANDWMVLFGTRVARGYTCTIGCLDYYVHDAFAYNRALLASEVEHLYDAVATTEWVLTPLKQASNGGQEIFQYGQSCDSVCTAQGKKCSAAAFTNMDLDAAVQLAGHSCKSYKDAFTSDAPPGTHQCHAGGCSVSSGVWTVKDDVSMDCWRPGTSPTCTATANNAHRLLCPCK